MPGIRNMQIGAALGIGGAALTAATVGISGGTFVVAFWGAILVGVIQFCWGAVQWISYQAKSPEAKIVHHLKVDVRVMIRSMIAVAAVDKRLDRGEIQMIDTIAASLLGERVGEDRIREIFSDMAEKNYIEELAIIAREASPTGAEMAVKGAILVARSDGSFDDEERNLTERIAYQLGVSGERLKRCAAEAHDIYNQMIGEPPPKKTH